MGAARCWIGTSGWVYPHWRGTFYPEDLPQKQWFAYYAEHFPTVEINKTFYSLPQASTVADWYAATPEGFRYAVKYSRFGTHQKKLKDPDMHLPRFLERMRPLREALGPILVQLPPRWKPNPERLQAFLDACPRDDLDWAVEIRDARWFEADVVALCAGRGVTIATHDMLPEHPPPPQELFAYMRFHGDHYRGSYDEERLDNIAAVAADIAHQGRTVWIYFNNDEAGHAPRNADRLRQLVAQRGCPV